MKHQRGLRLLNGPLCDSLSLIAAVSCTRAEATLACPVGWQMLLVNFIDRLDRADAWILIGHLFVNESWRMEFSLVALTRLTVQDGVPRGQVRAQLCRNSKLGLTWPDESSLNTGIHCDLFFRKGNLVARDGVHAGVALRNKAVSY